MSGEAKGGQDMCKGDHTFSFRTSTPFPYPCHFHMAILIAYFIGMKEDHQTLLNFAILAGKWQKTHLLI